MLTVGGVVQSDIGSPHFLQSYTSQSDPILLIIMSSVYNTVFESPTVLFSFLDITDNVTLSALGLSSLLLTKDLLLQHIPNSMRSNRGRESGIYELDGLDSIVKLPRSDLTDN